jgi:methionine sulfoxide reductase catalytic subunit
MTPFPEWLRIGHFINVIFIILLIRSGIEILSAHPKLYLSDDTTDGNEWAKFSSRKMPRDKLWTSDDEAESYNSWVALPGHSQLGIGRHWHFFSIIFWPLNGIVYYVLLFDTGTWRTIVPTSWDIFPQAWNTGLIFLSGNLPPAGAPFDPAAQLSYFLVIFILGPLMIVTGPAMSPAFGARFPNYLKIFGGRQKARSLHFIVMALFSLYIIVHVTLVIVDRIQINMANIILGGDEVSLGVAVGFLFIYFAVIAVTNVLATKFSQCRPRGVQRALGSVLEPVRIALMHGLASKQYCGEAKITPSFRINGRPPETEEYQNLLKDNFKDWKLKIYGLVDKPQELSLEKLKTMRKSIQITRHVCIQGWTAAAEWGGVTMPDLINLCQPRPEARYVVFRSLAYGDLDQYGAPGFYWTQL